MSRRKARDRMTRPNAYSTTTPHDDGFTLVEMLVSVTLVVLMMLLFTEIFQVATGTMSKQKGIAANDQRSRILNTVIRGDLGKRTYRNLIPFAANESPNRLGLEPGLARGDLDNRQGFFYISENDPKSSSDDVLHFTMRSTNLLQNSDESYFYGQATTQLGNVGQDKNQPVWDDGNSQNGASASTEAEVVYFLRSGNLYRRIMLIRQPLLGMNAQPRSSQLAPPEIEFFDSQNGYVGNFWDEFDFAAFNFSDPDPSSANPDLGLLFHGSDSLNNHYHDGGISVRPLAVPNYRFGFYHLDGQPREFIGTEFIGRFTHEETSHSRFKYPFDNTNTFHPMTGTFTMKNGVVDEFKEGPRRGEDILMTNVHAFDIKVWDDIVDQFVNIGHSLQDAAGNNGYYHADNNQNLSYGPDGPAGNNVFDTWHPDVDRNEDDTPEQPPYRPYNLGADGKPGIAGFDDDNDGDTDELDGSERLAPNSDDFLVAVKAIQITILFKDPSSDQMRQITIVHSMLDSTLDKIKL